MGDVVNQGLIRMAAMWGNNRYTHELFHWFGDPTMRIWTENPNPNAITASYPVSIPSGSSSLSISSCSESDALATLCQDGQLLAKVTLSGGSGTLIFSPISGPVKAILTISKKDCKPLVDQLSIDNCSGPVSDFTANITDANSTTSISFSDLSGCGPTTWHWNFPGGDPSYSSAQNPIIRYDEPGLHDVVLTTINAQGMNTMIKTNFITIADTIIDIYMSDDCNAAASWQMTSGTSNWQNVDPTTPADDHSIGGNCFITAGNSNYGTGTSYILSSSSIDLSSVTSCELIFWMYLRQEGSNYDGGFIELYDGSSWNTVGNEFLNPAYDGTLGASYGNPYGGSPAWFNNRTTWTKVTVDLDAAGYAGISDFRIRFKFGADNYSQTVTGWAIDDISICKLSIPFCPNHVVWTGMDNNNSWSNPGNWSNNAVPDAQTNVLIPQYKPGSDYPQTFTPSSIEVGDVTVGPGAILRIPSGYSLTVNGDLVIED
jgi:PKD repeat protein